MLFQDLQNYSNQDIVEYWPKDRQIDKWNRIEKSDIKSTIVSPFICHEMMGLDAMILVF